MAGYEHTRRADQPSSARIAVQEARGIGIATDGLARLIRYADGHDGYAATSARVVASPPGACSIPAQRHPRCTAKKVSHVDQTIAIASISTRYSGLTRPAT